MIDYDIVSLTEMLELRTESEIRAHNKNSSYSEHLSNSCFLFWLQVSDPVNAGSGNSDCKCPVSDKGLNRRSSLSGRRNVSTGLYSNRRFP